MTVFVAEFARIQLVERLNPGESPDPDY
jgi:hypothetical protein